MTKIFLGLSIKGQPQFGIHAFKSEDRLGGDIKFLGADFCGLQARWDEDSLNIEATLNGTHLFGLQFKKEVVEG